MLDGLRTRLKTTWDYGKAAGRGDLERGQIQSVLTVVLLGLVIVLGVLIYSEVQTQVFPGLQDDPANNTVIEGAASNATTDFGDAMELAPVIMIVLIAAIVLGVVQRFGG